MKKLILISLSAFFITVLVACGETSSTNITTDLPTTAQTTVTETTIVTTEAEVTTMAQLATPTSVTVSDNVLTFTDVSDATKYRIVIFDDQEQQIGEYNITNGFNLALLLGVGSYSFQLKATANGFLDSNYTESTDFEIVDPNRTNQLAGEEMNDTNFVRWLGRTYYNSEEALRYFYFTASGFELAFFGTEVKATISASRYNVVGKQVYLVVLVDGEEDPTKGTTIVLNQAEAEYTLATGLDDGYHTIKVLKRSEASDSDSAVKNLTTDGYFTNPPQAKTFNIQYIAASSSTGYGNLGSLSENKSTDNSNGLLAYAYLTSYLLDAGTSIFAASGWGVSRGYNTPGFDHNPYYGGIDELQNIPTAFEYVAIDDSNSVFTAGGKWDISDYIPDVIVVNLGTNDFNASAYSTMSEQEKADMEAVFEQDYTDFLILLNNMYPNAKIIVAYGLMNEQNVLEDITLQIVSNANTAIDSTVVTPFVMEGAGSNGNPYGCNYHPNVQTSMNVAEALADLISTITGRQILREMVTYE